MRSKKTVVSSKKSPRFANAIGAGVIGLAAVCLMATAILIATREPSEPADATASEPHPQEDAWTAPAPNSVPMPQAQAKKTPAAKPRAAVSTAKAPEPTTKVAVVEPEGVTITGCLERDADKFRLRDTVGVDAPKLRSWKSGFLKKGSASIAIVDAANRLKLGNHIGERVTVTGVLLDRQMQARSLQRVGTSCVAVKEKSSV